ncbi:MAG: M23 family metallopeptidase [Candidatus Rokubacteria bacterium]|nr:M23 family metallopeptidase [Candidatus Rokubacteria bacterium]
MPRQSHGRLWLLVVLVLLLVVVGPISYLGWRQSAAGVRVTSAPPKLIGHKTATKLMVEAARGNVSAVEVFLVQGDKRATAAKVEGTLGSRAEVPLTLETSALGLREGSATLEVHARDDYWRPLNFSSGPALSAPVTIDLTPPKLEILSATQYLANGGVGLVVFRLEGAPRAQVAVGATTFPSFPYGPPERGARVSLIALPYDLAPGTPLAIRAEDEAGNVTTRGIPAEIKPRKFPTDRIEVRDSFLQAKVPELLPQRSPSQPLIEGFLVINRDQRKQAEQEKRRIGAQTADTPLWEGPFVQPRNTKVFANFAEARTYFYEGREIDTQVHFGFDLASTKQSPVPAANRGVVVFAGPLTIYGNTVVVDHGLGLQTLYAHMSIIDVKPGDRVEKGQPLGRSGTTGLALGDHIHYETLIGGISVTPVEWWDAKWIREKVNLPLRSAGLPEIAGF